MSTIKENLANNIVELRKINNLTQSELAEKLNYTDKTISKWERGESSPDVESLCVLANIFNLTVDDLVHGTYSKEAAVNKGKSDKSKFYAKCALAVLTIWLLATSIFVYAIINDAPLYGVWMSFVWSVPVSFTILLLIAFFKKFKKSMPIYASATLWSFLVSIHVQMCVLGENMWIIYIIGIPLEAIIILTYWINN